MTDLLPAQTERWRGMEDQIHALMKQYAYQEIRTPLLEASELYVKSVGEQTDIVQKEQYRFEDKNGDWITLRPEGTASVVRSLVQNTLWEEGRITRLYYMGPMFRRERPQKGRYRQFHQFGLECFGSHAPSLDVEVILVLSRLAEMFGLTAPKLKLNSLGDLPSRAVYRDVLLTYLEKHRDALDETTRERMAENPLRAFDSKAPETQAVMSAAPILLDYISDDERAHFDHVRSHLENLNIAYEVDPKIVRGLDYYTHTVFEMVSQDLGSQNAVGGGGRYNHLVASMGGKSCPAVGFAMGLERLLMIAHLKEQSKVRKLVAFPLCPEAESGALRLCEKVRDLGDYEVEWIPGKSSLKAALRLADKVNADYAVFVGETELAASEFMLKEMQSGEQSRHSATALCNWLIQHKEATRL